MADNNEAEYEVIMNAGCNDATTYNVNKYRKLVEEYPFSLEYYYDSIKKHSFPTKFVELNIDIVRAMIQCYKHNALQRDAPSQEQIELLALLEEQLDMAIKSFGPAGAFVRLSRRSPKDCILDCAMCRTRIENILMEKLAKIPPTDKDLELREAMNTLVQGMRVTTGTEAMELLLNSERVSLDLQLAADFPNATLAGEGKFFVNIAVREWTDIPAESEFRAFIYQRKLTAICQYCDIFYFGPEYVAQKAKYEALMRQKFEEVKDTLPMESCILDFVVLADGTVYIMELNPFKHTTGAGLFDWGRDKQLLHGEKPFEFKMIEEPIVDPEGEMISPTCLMLIQSAREKLESGVTPQQQEQGEQKCNIM